ncbi:hypothetical protein GQ457_03G042330 [Hibiscus cannabinus]
MISKCQGINNLVLDFELPGLEVLPVDDQTLASIGKRCGRLSRLNSEGCLNVATGGVEAVIVNCKELKVMNLRWCNNVSVDVVAWLVLSRPSLRKITLPCASLLTANQRNFFLRHGCLVCQG